MNDCVGTKNEGSFLKPTSNWDGKDKTYEFVIHSQPYFNYAKYMENQRLVSCRKFFLKTTPYVLKWFTKVCFSISDKGRIECRSCICAIYVIYDMSTTIIGTQGENAHVVRNN